MLDNCGDSVGFPDADVDAPCVDRGRLAGLLLRLHARRFTGLAYVAAHGRTMTFAFREGTPVMIETSTPESSLAEDLVERGLLTRDDYAEIIARVTEELVENEEVAFCEHAVALGCLAPEQVQEELSERVRQRLIQSLSWVDCEVDLDESEESLPAVVEYPQKLGAAVYMGVRTFYEEDVLQSFVPDLQRHYLRLTKSSAEIARFFELDYEEVALLNAIDPQLRAASWFAAIDLEPTHALQLIALLIIGQMCEVSRSAFVPPEAERSGVRSAARPDSGRAVSRAAMNAVREPGRGSDARGARSDARDEASARRPVPAIREEIVAPRSGRAAGFGAQVPLRPDTDPQPSPFTQPKAADPAVVVDAAAEALAEARARVARDARRRGSYAAQPAVREPDPPAQRPMTPARQEREAPARAPSTQGQPAVPQPTAAATPEYQKAHLKELMQRRLGVQADLTQQSRREPSVTLRQAQESLREGQYSRAEEQLRLLTEQSPADDTLRAYHLWARLRAAHDLDPAQLGTLRDLAKKLVSNPEHGGFGCYVLAHLYLADKKDEQAEKYFRKAHQLDKSNKDAERHIVILERRKQQANEADPGGQRKLFGFSFNKGKGE